MTTDEYVPDESYVRHRYISGVADIHGTPEWEGGDEFDRFLAARDARVRRDAGREALNRLIEHAELLAERAGDHYTARSIWQTVAGFAEGNRDVHYPEEKK